MKTITPRNGCKRLALVTLLFACLPATPVLADGMLPETSVVIVYEDEGEAAISVRNTDPRPSLLHVTLQDIPEDTEPLLFVTPPVSRVEPGQNQLVRFILRNTEPLQTQRLKRVLFEGLQAKSKLEPGRASVAVNIRQNLPVIIHPKGLPPNREPWKGLTWSIDQGELIIRNDTPYVVRMGQELQLLPMMASVQFPASYVLPGTRHTLALPDAARKATSVRMYPATVYGFAVDAYDASIVAVTR